jgi:peptide/nickel transport system permease protein
VVTYLIRRVLWAAVLLVAVTFVSYVIFFLVPANPARLMTGPQAPPDQVARVEKLLGLDDPVPIQYARFMKKLVLEQSLGRSFATRQEVNDIIVRAAPVTASVVFGGVLIWLSIAFPIGILSALRPRSLLDRGAMIFVLIGVSAHPVWIGLIFSYFFGVRWHITPIADYANFFGAAPGSGDPGGPAQWAYHMILPWMTFAILFAALYVRMIRANVMETLNEDYVRTARAKGAPEQRILFAHVLRNALLPVVTMLGMDIGVALGGAIFTETVFQLPGLGRTIVVALGNDDLAIVEGVVVFATIAILFFNLIVDLMYAWIDPRIRLS